MRTVQVGAVALGDEVALSGDYGKPRPALVIQSDAFDLDPSVTVLVLTSELHEAPLLRITVRPDHQTGLRAISQIMIDKAQTVPREKIGQQVGHIDPATMRKVNSALAAFLGLRGCGLAEVPALVLTTVTDQNL